MPNPMECLYFTILGILGLLVAIAGLSLAWSEDRTQVKNLDRLERAHIQLTERMILNLYDSLDRIQESIDRDAGSRVAPGKWIDPISVEDVTICRREMRSIGFLEEDSTDA